MLNCMEDIFSLLRLIRLNDLKLLYAAILSFSFKGFTHAGSYTRDIIFPDKGLPRVVSICIYRVRIRGDLSGRTFSIRPDFLIPGSSCSIRLVLTVLFAYDHRRMTVSDFCEKWGVSRPTLRSWKQLFRQNCHHWLQILSDMKKTADDILSASPGIASLFPEVWIPGFSVTLHNSFLPFSCLPP